MQGDGGREERWAPTARTRQSTSTLGETARSWELSLMLTDMKPYSLIRNWVLETHLLRSLWNSWWLVMGPSHLENDAAPPSAHWACLLIPWCAAVIFQTFGLWTSLCSYTLLRTPKIFTVSEVKIKKVQKYLLIHLKIIIQLHVNVNTILLKITIFYKAKKFGENSVIVLPFCFCKSLNALLKRRHMDSHICFRIQSDVIYYFG